MKFKIKFMIYSIIISTMLFNPIINYAEVSNVKNSESQSTILTYDDAVKKAIDESIDLKILSLKTESEQIQMDRTLESFGGSYNNPQLLAMLNLQKANKLNSQSLERAKNSTIAGIEFRIKSIFNNISTIKSDLKIENDKYINSMKKRDTMALKLEYGMESKTNLISKDIEIKQMKKEIEALEKKLDDQYLELNKLLGNNPFERYEIEDLTFEYNPINDTEEDIEFNIVRTISSDFSVWAKEQNLDIQRLNIDFYGLNFIDGAPSNQQPGATPYQSLKLDKNVSSNELDKLKEDIKVSVISKYNSIKELENSYDTALLKLKDLEEKKRILEVAIEAGTAIKQDYEDLNLGIKELNNGLEKMKNQHALLVEMYTNPTLAGSNIN